MGSLFDDLLVQLQQTAFRVEQSDLLSYNKRFLTVFSPAADERIATAEANGGRVTAILLDVDLCVSAFIAVYGVPTQVVWSGGGVQYVYVDGDTRVSLIAEDRRQRQRVTAIQLVETTYTQRGDFSAGVEPVAWQDVMYQRC